MITRWHSTRSPINSSKRWRRGKRRDSFSAAVLEPPSAKKQGGIALLAAHLGGSAFAHASHPKVIGALPARHRQRPDPLVLRTEPVWGQVTRLSGHASGPPTAHRVSTSQLFRGSI